ncbi:hypothetical protein F4805DRAFT_475369 [Annulohypoxylon moriforme]|nr:hypothetical protein F4805DRAFT_475369 [Annulohypoxylon moriforme]
MVEQRQRASSPFEIPTSSPEFQLLPIRLRKMSNQATTSTTSSEEQTTITSSDNSTSPTLTFSTSGPSVSTTAVEQEAWRTLYPPSPVLRDDLDARFDPPFPDPELESDPYTPYTPYTTFTSSSFMPLSPPTQLSQPEEPGQEKEKEKEKEKENGYATSPPYSPSSADADAEADPVPYMSPLPDPRDMWPIIQCPCPCHSSTETREGRPWLAFSNESYAVCPMCWIDAYMTAHGDQSRLVDCETYLRALGKDPKVPASQQC